MSRTPIQNICYVKVLITELYDDICKNNFNNLKTTIETCSQVIINACTENSAATASTLFIQERSYPYTSNHAVDSATVAYLLAREFNHKDIDITALVCASLTMT
ncbi:MAG: hypothetical protein HON94_05675 [Methylococcales bacterium]|jgi:hypothetical protein|nr:hypothetical protein [Methylococcales bacterium]MBT7409299.1 hypothetical protein [Methylococcales bacterium]